MAPLGDFREHRKRAEVSPRPEVRGGLASVVPGHHGDSLHFLVCVQASLSCLHLDQVHRLGLFVQEDVVKSEKNCRTPSNRKRGPFPLGLPGPAERHLYIVGCRRGQLRDNLARHGGTTHGTAAALDPSRESKHQVRGHYVGHRPAALCCNRVAVTGSDVVNF